MSLKIDFREPFALAYVEKELDRNHVITGRVDRLIHHHFNEKEQICTLAYASATNYLILVNCIQADRFMIIHNISIDMTFLSTIFDNAYADHLGKLQHELNVLHDHYITDQKEMVKYKAIIGSLNVHHLSDYRTSFTTMIDHIIEVKREVLETAN